MALANIEAAKHAVNAAKLALAAWPRDRGDKTTPKLPATLDVLGLIMPKLRERQLIAAGLTVFSPDWTRIVTASSGVNAQVRDAASGRVIAALTGLEAPLRFVYFSPDGTRIVTASVDRTSHLWDAASGPRSQRSWGIATKCGPRPSAPTGHASRHPTTRQRGCGPRAPAAASPRSWGMMDR